jgi:hypothetical protein
MKREYKIRQHGTYEGFTHGCDCNECWRAYKEVRGNRDKQTEHYRPKKTSTYKGEKKSLDFTKMKHGIGYTYNRGCRCEPCVAYSREKYARLARSRGVLTKEESLAKRRANPVHSYNRYKMHKCRCDICVADHKRWYDENKEGIRSRQRQYNATHKEQTLASVKAYYELHRDEINAKQRARYAKKRELKNAT